MPANPGDYAPQGQYADLITVGQGITQRRMILNNNATELAGYLEFERGNEVLVKQGFWQAFYGLFELSHTRKVIRSNDEYGKVAVKVKEWFNRENKSKKDYADGLQLAEEWINTLEDAGLI